MSPTPENPNPASPNPDKARQRTDLRAARDAFVAAMTPADRIRLEAAAADRLAPLIADARCVSFYVAMGSELGCGPAIDVAAARGIAIALPYVEARGTPMRFLRWAPGEPLVEGWYGLLQPAADSPEIAPDRIVAPLLGFDSRLARIGQGAGFYDRAFARHRDARRIGYGWSIQQSPVIALDRWDEPLDAVVTEAGTIEGKTAS